MFTTKTPSNSKQEGHKLVFLCVTLRLRAFAVKGFYRMPSRQAVHASRLDPHESRMNHYFPLLEYCV